QRIEGCGYTLRYTVRSREHPPAQTRGSRGMTITPPLIISDDLDVMVFRSQADAERFVEARDVVSGRLRAWDVTGRPLRIDIEDAMCIDLATVALSDRVKADEAAGDLA